MLACVCVACVRVLGLILPFFGVLWVWCDKILVSCVLFGVLVQILA